MFFKEMKRKAAPWIAAGFCATLCIITISANLTLSVVNHTDVGGWAIVFLCFLPMCFFFVGSVVSDMQAQIRDLRKQIEDLGKTPATH